MKRYARESGILIAVFFLLATFGGLAVAQGKRIVVLSFEQNNVNSSIEEVFGGEADIGEKLADLVRAKLRERSVEVAESNDGVQGTVSGSILVFGRQEGGGEVAGVSVGGLRVGLGRRREKAYVVLEARLVDAGSGRTVSVLSGRGESDRSGTDLFARTRNIDLASIDLTSEEFTETSIGEATHQAVDELAEEIADATDELGDAPAPAAPTDPPAATPAPVAPAAAVSGGPVAPFIWAPYQFNGTEHFKYDVNQTEDGSTETGFYQLDLEPAGPGQVRMQVSGQLGDDSYSSTVTTGTGTQGMMMGYPQFMTMGPVGLMLFNPMSWMAIQGRQLTLGDGWSATQDGETMEARVESQCQAAGQSGMLLVFRENGVVRTQSCLAPNIALPITTSMHNDDMTIELTLVEYRP
jgi:hypothetical protein